VLTKIFLTEIERLLLAASGGTPDADMPRAARPRLGGISFLHRFGSALNHHVHLHALGVWLVVYQEKVPDPFWAHAFCPDHPPRPGNLSSDG